MTTIYYLSTIIFLWQELRWITSPIERTENAKNFFKLTKENKGKKWNEFSKEYKSELKSKMFLVYIFIWMFIGLLTFQWFGFLAMLIFNLLFIAPISKLTKFSVSYTVIHWINSVIGFVFAVFVIINHYHLKIDLFQFFLSLVK